MNRTCTANNLKWGKVPLTVSFDLSLGFWPSTRCVFLNIVFNQGTDLATFLLDFSLASELLESFEVINAHARLDATLLLDMHAKQVARSCLVANGIRPSKTYKCGPSNSIRLQFRLPTEDEKWILVRQHLSSLWLRPRCASIVVDSADH